jgi:hypothetical protein
MHNRQPNGNYVSSIESVPYLLLETNGPQEPYVLKPATDGFFLGLRFYSEDEGNIPPESRTSS